MAAGGSERNDVILCIGLTPTNQRTMFFDRFQPGAVNRARETLVTASGKAVNVCRVLSILGKPARLIQILGGDSGRILAQELDRSGIPHQSLWASDDTPTRTCTTILAPESTTELVEEAPAIMAGDLDRIASTCHEAMRDASAICFSGSLPPGAPATFYAELLQQTAGIPTVLDTQGPPLKAALASRPLLAKPNLEESARTLGFELTGDAARDARTGVTALIEAGAQWALVSMGANGSLLGNGAAMWHIIPPEVEVVNPIGSGDSLAAGTLAALESRSMPEAVAYGTACAAANCLTPVSGMLDPADVERLGVLVRVECLH